MAAPSQPLQWREDAYLISTDSKLLSLEAINTAFANSSVYWTNPIPTDALRTMVDSSLCFGLYDTSKAADNMEQGAQVGLARLITDNVSFAYLTDVYVDEAYQGKGLGSWLIGCIRDWLQGRPHFRALTLLTTNEKAVELYKRLLGTQIDPKLKLLIWKGPGAGV